MYNTGLNSNRHGLVNGFTPSQQFSAVRMNPAKTFHPANLPSANLHNSSQESGSLHMSHLSSAYQGHSHSLATGLGLRGASPLLSNSTLPCNTSNSVVNVEAVKGNLDDWEFQSQLYQVSKDISMPHSRAHSANLLARNTGLGNDVSNGENEQSLNERPSGVHMCAFNKPHTKPAFAEIDMSGQNFRNLAPPLFNYTFLTKLWLGHNKLRCLPSSIRSLRSLTHLDVSFNLLTRLPEEIGMLSFLRELLLFDNQLKSLPSEIGYLCKLEVLGLEGNPLPDKVKIIMKKFGTKALIKRFLDTSPILAPPAKRDWVVINETSTTSTNNSTEPYQHDKLIVMTFNVLCKLYATREQYAYTPGPALNWARRRSLILEEIRERNADIVCLQEVDQKTYEEYFRPRLAHNNYKGVYWAKSRARRSDVLDPGSVDGCATFFKNYKFILLDKHLVEYAQIMSNRPEGKGAHDFYNRVMPRDDIGVVIYLENRYSGVRIIVANTHVFWNEDYRDVKLIQTALLMDCIDRLREKFRNIPCIEADEKRFPIRFSLKGKKPFTQAGEKLYSDQVNPEICRKSVTYADSKDIPTIVCGDFNSTPSSAVYEFLSQGCLPGRHEDLAPWNYGTFASNGLSHSFNLKSSYSDVGELRFTNYTPGFSGTIDYIWHSASSLQVSGLLGEIDKKYIEKFPGFPNYHFPSDHIPLVAEFIVNGPSVSSQDTSSSISSLSLSQSNE